MAKGNLHRNALTRSDANPIGFRSASVMVMIVPPPRSGASLYVLESKALAFPAAPVACFARFQKEVRSRSLINNCEKFKANAVSNFLFQFVRRQIVFMSSDNVFYVLLFRQRHKSVLSERQPEVSSSKLPFSSRMSAPHFTFPISRAEPFVAPASPWEELLRRF